MMEPGRGSSSDPIRLASSNCFSSSKRWKREEAWIAEMWARSSVNVVTNSREDGGLGGTGAVGQRCPSSNASPARNFAG